MKKLVTLLILSQLVLTGASFADVNLDQMEVVSSSRLYFNGEPVDAILYATNNGSDETAETLDFGKFNRFSFEIYRLGDNGADFVAGKNVSPSAFPGHISRGRTVVTHALDITNGRPLSEGTYLLKFVASYAGGEPFVITTNFRVYQSLAVRAASVTF